MTKMGATRSPGELIARAFGCLAGALVLGYFAMAAGREDFWVDQAAHQVPRSVGPLPVVGYLIGRVALFAHGILGTAVLAWSLGIAALFFVMRCVLNAAAAGKGA